MQRIYPRQRFEVDGRNPLPHRDAAPHAEPNSGECIEFNYDKENGTADRLRSAFNND